MYAIIIWIAEDYVTFLHNSNGSIKLYDTLKEADEYANSFPKKDDLRVVNLEGVKE
jgi:hypothetical protein